MPAHCSTCLPPPRPFPHPSSSQPALVLEAHPSLLPPQPYRPSALTRRPPVLAMRRRRPLPSPPPPVLPAQMTRPPSAGPPFRSPHNQPRHPHPPRWCQHPAPWRRRRHLLRHRSKCRPDRSRFLSTRTHIMLRDTFTRRTFRIRRRTRICTRTHTRTPTRSLMSRRPIHMPTPPRSLRLIFTRPRLRLLAHRTLAHSASPRCSQTTASPLHQAPTRGLRRLWVQTQTQARAIRDRRAQGWAPVVRLLCRRPRPLRPAPSAALPARRSHTRTVALLAATRRPRSPPLRPLLPPPLTRPSLAWARAQT